MEEIWKDIVDDRITDRYEVSNKGNIRHKIKKKIRKSSLNHHGYHTVTLPYKHDWKKCACFKLHRLILLSFMPIDNPDDYDVHHKNGIKIDNRLENLEWILKTEHCKQRHKRITLQKIYKILKNNLDEKKYNDILCKIRESV